MSKLITPAQRAQLRSNNIAYRSAIAAGTKPPNTRPVVKLLARGNDAVWLLDELEDDLDTAIGLFDGGGGRVERQSVSLAELEALTVAGNEDLALFEVDAEFAATKSSAGYAREAKRLGRIAR